MLIKTTGLLSNTYIIKYLQNVKEENEVDPYSDGLYLYLNNNQFLLSDSKKYNTIKTNRNNVKITISVAKNKFDLITR